MKAILLAAGVGKRLWPRTAECPKCLLRFDGHTLLARTLTALERAGVREVVIVVGYLKRRIVDAVTHSQTRLTVRYVENPRYQKGSLLSLWRAREELNEDLLTLDADVLGPPVLLSRLVHSAHANAVLFDPRMKPSGEDMMLGARDGRVWHIGRQVTGTWDTVGESVGFYKLTEEASRRLRQSLELCIRQGKIHADYEHALLPVLQECVVGYERVADLPWVEIDTPADVERAEQEIVPQLRKGDA